MKATSRSVAAIREGTVIDHIAAGSALAICRLLGIDRHAGQVTIGLNLISKRLGHKDVIKVSGREITPDEANRLALLAPCATINIVKEHQVASKFRVECPEVVEGMIVCPNPRCITNCEPVESRFGVTPRQGEKWLRCHFCERSYPQSEIESYRA